MKKSRVKKFNFQKLFIRIIALLIVIATLMPIIFSVYLKCQNLNKMKESNFVYAATEGVEVDGYYIGREFNSQFDSMLKMSHKSQAQTENEREYEEVSGNELVAKRITKDAKRYSNIVLCANGIFKSDGIFITLYDKNANSLGCKRFSDVVGADNKLMPISFDSFTGFVINQINSGFSVGEVYGASIYAEEGTCILIKSIFLTNLEVKEKAIEFPRFEKEKLKAYTKNSFTINAGGSVTLPNDFNNITSKNYECIVFKIKNSENFSTSNFAISVSDNKAKGSKIKYSNELYSANGISLQDIVLSDYPYKSLTDDVFLIVDLKESTINNDFNLLHLYNLSNEKIFVSGVFLANKSDLSLANKDSSEIDYKNIKNEKNIFERFLKLKLKADSVYNFANANKDYLDASNKPIKEFKDFELKFLICNNNIVVESRKYAIKEFIGDNDLPVDASKILSGQEVILDLRASQIPPHSAVEIYIDGEKVAADSFESISYIDATPSYAKSLLSFEKTLDKIAPQISINLEEDSLSGQVNILVNAYDDYTLKEEIKLSYSVEIDGTTTELVDNKFAAQKEGVYSVTVKASDENGNEALASDSIEITSDNLIGLSSIYASSKIQILVTTAISCFFISVLLMIYNRKCKVL